MRFLTETGIDTIWDIAESGAGILEKSFDEIIKEKLQDIPKDILKEKLLGIPSVGELIRDSIPQFTKHSIENAEQYLRFVNQKDRKYLIYNPYYRKIFVGRIADAIRDIETIDKFGYLPQRESDEFKKQILQRLNRIIQMNENFEYEKVILDEEWQRINDQWAKEFPIIVTDPKYKFLWRS